MLCYVHSESASAADCVIRMMQPPGPLPVGGTQWAHLRQIASERLSGAVGAIRVQLPAPPPCRRHVSDKLQKQTKNRAVAVAKGNTVKEI